MRDVFSRIAAAPARAARNTSAASRLSLITLIVALFSLVITSVVGLQRGGDLANELLRDRLSAVGNSRADEVERYMASLQRATVSQAISPSTADAIEQFTEATAELAAGDLSDDDEVAVEDFYRDVVATELETVRGRPVSGAGLQPRRAAAVHLQANYVVPSDGSLIVDADDGSRWSEIHRELHPSLSEFVVQTGFDDMYLIEPRNKIIVYSTSKGIDLSTSLVTGPHSGSALAAVINAFPPNPPSGTATIVDASRYAAAGDAPSIFIASPVIADGMLAGFVAVRLGAAQLSSITTNDGAWQSLGASGETYIVGGDGLMRSDARPFVEDQAAYITAATEVATASEDQLRSIEQVGTTALFQPANDDDVRATLDRGARLVETTNYLGVDVLSAESALDIEGLDWVLFSELSTQEVDQPIEDFARNLLVAIALFVVAITFLTVRWADRLLLPLRSISTRLRAVRRGDDETDSTDLQDTDTIEFAELAGDIDTMLGKLSQQHSAAEQQASERRELLRRILPSQIVKRAEAGERDVLDQIANATVAVVSIRGLGSMMTNGSTEGARDLLDDFIGEADAVAKKHGLDRIRLTGDSYVAACGTVRPHLDHAQRAATFVLEMLELISELDEERGIIEGTGGLASGPVTVGLTGGSRLVYDSWGPAVRAAIDLARRAAPGEILIAPSTESLLPSSFVIEASADLAAPTDTAADDAVRASILSGVTRPTVEV